MPRLSLLTGAFLGLLAGSCAAVPNERYGEHELPIENGEIDPHHTAVFRVITRQDGLNGLCSATLIAPNLLLSARHCVAENEGEDVVCGRTTFGATSEPANLLFSNEVTPDLDSRWYSAEAVLVPDESLEFCGNDIALVRLSEPVPERVATPLPPRLDEAPRAFEAYVAVGYGASDTDGAIAEYGTRRFRDDLRIECRGAECESEVLDNEFAGLEGGCRGDSGGPALDELGRVIGTLSRGSGACEFPVYTNVFAFGAWLVEEAERASSQGSTALPGWAGGEPERENDAGTPELPRDAALPAEGGCTLTRGESRGVALFALVALLALARGRTTARRWTA